MINILIVDDEVKICEFIEAYLKKAGYHTIVAKTGNEALEIIDKDKVDLIILDRMMPDISGEEICRYIRLNSSIPIVMITAKTEDNDKIEGFNLGCDDYICKPFNPQEMVLRVDALIRRCNINKNETIKLKNGIELDQIYKIVKVNGEEIELTKTEYKIIEMFILNPGKIFDREKILQIAINESCEKLDRAVDTHIKNIRKKIEKDAKYPKIITTVYGVGYKFEQ